MLHFGAGPPAQVALQVSTNCASVRSKVISSMIFARTLLSWSFATSRASEQSLLAWVRASRLRTLCVLRAG